MPMQDSIEFEHNKKDSGPEQSESEEIVDSSPRGNGVTHCIYCGMRFDICNCDEHIKAAEDFVDKLRFEKGER